MTQRQNLLLSAQGALEREESRNTFDSVAFLCFVFPVPHPKSASPQVAVTLSPEEQNLRPGWCPRSGKRGEESARPVVAETEATEAVLVL